MTLPDQSDGQCPAELTMNGNLNLL